MLFTQLGFTSSGADTEIYEGGKILGLGSEKPENFLSHSPKKLVTFF
jgi:hypothetical protein